MKILLSLFFIVTVFFGIFGGFIPSDSGFISNENRKRTEFPSFYLKNNFRNCFTEIDGFLKDNFPWRENLISAYRWGINFSGGQIDASRAFRGRDGWLFIGNIEPNSWRTIDKLEGRLIPDPEHSKLTDAIITTGRWFQEQGVKVIFVLGPNKTSVYPEKLPAIIKPAPERYIIPFLERLYDNGIEVVDPTAALLARKQADIVYWKRDTHWNQIGAYVAFSEAVNALGFHDCPAPSFEQDAIYRGDLTRVGMFEEPSGNSGDNFRVVWEKQHVQVVESIIDDPDISIGHEKTLSFDNPHAVHENTIWIVGDSFRIGMTPFASNCFSKTLVLHMNRNPIEKLQDYYKSASVKPSLLMIVRLERSF